MQRKNPFEESLFCCICTCFYSDSRKSCNLKECDHVYCEHCLQKILENPLLPPTCPLCRKPFGKKDIVVNMSTLQAVKAHLKTLALIDREKLRIQVREQLKDLEPSLVTLIELEKSIIGYYNEAITKTNNTLWASGTSMALKTLAAGLCFFPGTAPLGIAAMGLTSVGDLGQNFYFLQKENGVYCQLSETIKKHDSILHDQGVKEFFERYKLFQQVEFIQLMKLGETLDASNDSSTPIKLGSSLAHLASTGYGCVQYFNIDSFDLSAFTPGKISSDGCKTVTRSISTGAKCFIAFCICVEWAFFYQEMKKGKVRKEELKKQIEDTEGTISLFEETLQKSRENKI